MNILRNLSILQLLHSETLEFLLLNIALERNLNEFQVFILFL